MTTLHLHVGIHKTASTYIQHRLKLNQTFLRRHSIFYPPLRAEHLSLLKSFRRQQPSSWKALLERARRDHCDHVLISAESFSLAVSAQSENSTPRLSNIQWLSDVLGEHGCSLRIYSFVREQGEYLVSRYTQLIKRFYFSLDFPTYVSRVIAGGTESECDYQTLFGVILDNPDFACIFLPFMKGSVDPCERLLSSMQLKSLQGLKPLRDSQTNVQPGWRSVWIAQRVAQRLRRQDPARWKNPAIKAALRSKLEDDAMRNCWVNEPFSALTPNLRTMVNQRYAHSNDSFAQRVWGCQWNDIFPISANVAAHEDHRASLGAADRQLLKEEVDSLLQYALRLDV